MSTETDWRCAGYEAFRVDVEKGSVSLTWHAREKIDYLLRRAWLRAKRLGKAKAQGYKPQTERR